MSDGISFFHNDDIDIHLHKVLCQTNYTEEEARDKLKLFNCDYMRVIREYMGLPEKKPELQVKSVNQEIFRQIRTNLDKTMKEYRDKNPINMNQVIHNIQQSENKKNEL
jgi:hypothetical protein